MKCLECESENVEFISREDNIDIYMCNACGHMFVKEVIWTTALLAEEIQKLKTMIHDLETKINKGNLNE